MPEKPTTHTFIESLLASYKASAEKSIRAECEKKISALTTQLEESQAAREAAESMQTDSPDHDESNERISALEDAHTAQITALTKEKNLSDATLQAREKEILIYKTTLEKNKELLEIQKKTTAELEDRLVLVENERDTLTTEHAKSQKLLEDAIAAQSSSHNMESALEKKTAQINELEMHITTLHEQLTKLTAYETSSAALIEEQKKELALNKDHISELSVAHASLKETYESDHALLEESRQAMENATEMFEKKIHAKDSEIQCLRDALTIANKSKEPDPVKTATAEEVDTLKKEQATLLIAREEEKALITQVLANQKKDRASFENTVTEKNNEIQCLREALQAANTHTPSAQDDANTAEEVKKLQKQLQGKIMEIQCLREALAASSKKPASSETDETDGIAALKQKIDTLESEKAALEHARKEEQEMVTKLMAQRKK